MATAKTLDFSNVKDGGGNFTKKRLPSGDYLAKITKVEDAKSKSDEAFQYLFTIQLKEHTTATYPYYCKLVENQLWKLRNILIAAGKNVPKSKIKVDVNSIVGKTVGVTLDDTEYNDKEQSEIAAIFPAAELADNDSSVDEDEDASEEDDADAPLEEDEAEAEEEVEEEEPEAEEEEEEGDEWDAITDRLELRKALKRLSPDTKTSTSQTDDDIRDLIRAAAIKAKPAAKKPAAKPKAAEVSDEDLEELDIDAL